MTPPRRALALLAAVTLTGCGDLYGPRDKPCVSVCRAGDPYGPLNGDVAPDRERAANAHQMKLSAPQDDRCDRFSLDVRKLLAEHSADAAEAPAFQPGVLRVRAGGCQSGEDIAEIEVFGDGRLADGGISDERRSTVSFTLDLEPYIREGEALRLCVVKLDGADRCPQKAHWISDSISVSRTCESEPEQDAPAPPLSGAPRVWHCADPITCEPGRIYDHGDPARALEQRYCRDPMPHEKAGFKQIERLFTLQRIPAGAWVVGDEVVDIESFYLADAEASRRLYHLLYGRAQAIKPSDPCFWANGAHARGEGCPIAAVSWCSALALANALSEAAGLEACYAGVVCPEDEDPSECTCEGVTITAQGGDPRRCRGYRLPTELEWTHAALGGAPDGLPAARAQGNLCRSATCPLTTPACDFGANTFGLCDTIGNVWEWTWRAPGDPLLGPSCGDDTIRSVKGGSVFTAPGEIKRAHGGCWPEGDDPMLVPHEIGVRLARSAPETAPTASGPR